jgi:hypothetical protein
VLQHPQFTLSILDPTSLLGSETMTALWQAFPAARRRLFHTTGVDEHLVSEVAGEAVLVPPLGDAGELDGSDVVVATMTPSEGVGGTIVAWLRANPNAVLIDGTQPGVLPDESIPVFGAPRPQGGERRWFHLADPSLWGPGHVIRTLSPLAPRELMLTVLLPVSSFGEAGVEELATQAAARLSGRPLRRPVVLPAILAFDVAAAAAGRRAALERQVAALAPDVPCRIQALELGTFHGHSSVLALRCAAAVAAGKVGTLLRQAPGLRLARKNERAQPGNVVGSEEIVCADLRCDDDWITTWVLADGLRLGGGQAIADILEAVRAS